MKKMIILAMICLIPYSLFAVDNVSPASALISLTTSVPEYLIHGFLTDETSGQIDSSLTVTDAFNENGATILYAIKTNAPIALGVSATVTPFELLNSTTNAYVSIDQVLLGGTEVDPTSQNTYDLVHIAPSSQYGGFYTYTLTILVNQAEVLNAPSGDYQSTVSISITPDD